MKINNDFVVNANANFIRGTCAKEYEKLPKGGD